MAVMTMEGGAVAIVDGKLLHQGESIDGFTLTKVSQSTAVFVSDGHEAKLELKVNVGPRAAK